MNQTSRKSQGLRAFMILGLLLSVGAGAKDGRTEEPSETPFVVDEIRDGQRIPERQPQESAQRGVATVRFRRPLPSIYWQATTAYMDLDDTAGLRDYDCQALTYDGHNGNDTPIRDFVEQDEGRFVVAAAPGVVVETHDGEFDRHTVADPAQIGNHVIVEHADGTLTRYWHLRKWSVLVAEGQQVLEGQPLGQVGSSGFTNGSHLHFAVNFAGVDVEPHEGDCNPGQSLWQDQQPHVRFNPMTVFMTGISTLDPIVGNAYRFRPPDVFHVKQASGATTYFWVRLRYTHPGDVIRMIYRDPVGAVYDDRSATVTVFRGMDKARWTTALPLVGGLGTWTVEFQINSVQVATKSFVYDAVDYQNPVALGRTVPVLYGVAAGDLRGSDADSGIKDFRIVSQPANGTVALSGPRQSWFTYTPNSGFSGMDPFTFEVEDAQGQVSAAATMTMDVSPVMANVLRLEGEDDHVAVPYNVTLDLTQALALEAWIRRTAGSAGWNFLFDRRNASNANGYSFGIQPEGTLRFSAGDGTVANFAYSNTVIPMNRWTHVAAVWDGSMMRIYVNGVEEPNPVPFSGTIAYPGATETKLGRAVGAGASFRGEIDEMRAWSVARSATELQDGATCSFYDTSPPATLRGWWRFEGDAQDSSSFGNHGSLVAPAYFRITDGAFDACAALDTDLDSIVDDVDNCPRAANLNQADTDTDGLGDVCDGCPALFGPRQHDADRDGIADACDICPFRGNTDQDDTDGDGSGDLCDPDPADPGAGVPGAISALVLEHDPMTDETTINWTADALAASYAVIRGTLEELRARHYGACISSGDPDDTDTTFVDTEAPLAGELFAYLVVGVGAGDARGRSSLDSTGRMRDLRVKDCD